MSFTEYNFHPRVSAGIHALGFTEPTPIQARGIPPVLEGRDLLGLAQTGTGKTAAFVLPILERLMGGPRRVVRALILAPTRELAEQIHDVINGLTPHTGVRSMTIYGGVGMGPQIARLRGGVEVVVACPGRLLDHFERRTFDVSKLEVLVIDEADRMFDMGFLPDLRKVIARLPKKRQTLLYSATMPDEVHRLIHDVLHDPVTVKIGHAAPAATVEHALYPVPQHLKTPLLLEILNRTETGSVLVFTRTKHRTKKVARTLVSEGFAAAELQGNLSQKQRERSLDGFRDGSFRILVATDIAARGIDVSTISHVINYDIPDTADAYTHRIGRTGRMERTGDAFTFVTQEDAETIRDIERVLKAPIPRRKLENFDYTQSGQKNSNEFARGPRPQRHHAHHAKPHRGAHASPSHGNRPHAKAASKPHAHAHAHAHAGSGAPADSHRRTTTRNRRRRRFF